jgi:hypothetical protein
MINYNDVLDLRLFEFYHYFLKISTTLMLYFRDVRNLFHAIYVYFIVFVILLTFIRILLICSGSLV